MTTTDSPCADLSLFVDGELAAERAAAFRKHLDTCEACRTKLIQAGQLVARLSEREPT